MTPIRAGVVIPAGGAGRRMGGVRKPFLELPRLFTEQRHAAQIYHAGSVTNVLSRQRVRR